MGVRRSLWTVVLVVAMLTVACAGNVKSRAGSAASATVHPAATVAVAQTNASTPVASRTPILADAPPPGRGSGNTLILYAGSLVAVMENGIGPAFQKATGYTYQGEGRGSVALANLIKDKLRQPDVFISADPSVNDSLAGAKNGDIADWYVVWGRTTMVIAYSPKSRFVSQLDQARTGTLPWYQVLQTSGLRLGRTDPQLDPKGYRSLFMLSLAETFYKQTGLRKAILGADSNTDQVFPEEELVTRLQTGQLDAGIFYLSEVSELKLPFITLPDEVNQGNPQLAALYGQESYTNSKGQVFKGSPVLYTATVPSVGKNAAGGAAFVQYLGTAEARAILRAQGILPTNFLSGGDITRIPAPLRSLVADTYQP